MLYSNEVLADVIRAGGIQRVLTSGGHNSVLEGEQVIAAMVKQVISGACYQLTIEFFLPSQLRGLFL